MITPIGQGMPALDRINQILSVTRSGSGYGDVPLGAAVRDTPTTFASTLDQQLGRNTGTNRLALGGADSEWSEAGTARIGPDGTSAATSTRSQAGLVSSTLDWTSQGVPSGAPYAELFEQAGLAHGLSPKLLAAVAEVESGYRTDAVSGVGAQGLMQFMPATAESFGVDPWDPASAIDGAARYLRQLADRFGSVESALAAYNLGPGTVARAGGGVPAAGQRYVDKVMARVNGARS